MSDDERQIAKFAPNQTLPPGYGVVSHEGSEHWCWVAPDETNGSDHWDRFAARRDAWAHYNTSK